ncbi:hypothetical protein [Ornithinibacillus halotolerans]|uniref:Uncharacterized protein n=1 Tax=Ornithinibacillus halotolerans TaxID=1274357 RepID=A0A916RK34_9BACI|nr:hypothetical protein [Ornithinibacillus halotolerans]GGA60304.1 hypothetical protein GCM10008025_00400 [Ornithinibacillus halotolerans]
MNKWWGAGTGIDLSLFVFILQMGSVYGHNAIVYEPEHLEMKVKGCIEGVNKTEFLKKREKGHIAVVYEPNISNKKVVSSHRGIL